MEKLMHATTPAPHVVLILQARMGSARLPGKSMLGLAGAPLLARILERVRRSSQVHRIVVATTRNSEDDVLAGLAADQGVAAFRGAENDLVDRYYQAARAFGADAIVRLPADNAVFPNLLRSTGSLIFIFAGRASSPPTLPKCSATVTRTALARKFSISQLSSKSAPAAATRFGGSTRI